MQRSPVWPVLPLQLRPGTNDVAKVTVQPGIGEYYPRETKQEYIGGQDDSKPVLRASDGVGSDTMDMETCHFRYIATRPAIGFPASITASITAHSIVNKAKSH